MCAYDILKAEHYRVLLLSCKCLCVGLELPWEDVLWLLQQRRNVQVELNVYPALPSVLMGADGFGDGEFEKKKPDGEGGGIEH